MTYKSLLVGSVLLLSAACGVSLSNPGDSKKSASSGDAKQAATPPPAAQTQQAAQSSSLPKPLVPTSDIVHFTNDPNASAPIPPEPAAAAAAVLAALPSPAQSVAGLQALLDAGHLSNAQTKLVVDALAKAAALVPPPPSPPPTDQSPKAAASPAPASPH